MPIQHKIRGYRVEGSVLVVWLIGLRLGVCLTEVEAFRVTLQYLEEDMIFMISIDTLFFFPFSSFLLLIYFSLLCLDFGLILRCWLEG
jgi:hypothetical protein